MDELILKKAFTKVKEDISSLNNKLNKIENAINLLISQNNVQNPLSSNENSLKQAQNAQIQQSSSGNEGVQSINQSTVNQSINNQSHTNRSIEQYTPQISINYDKKQETNHSLINHSTSNQSTVKHLQGTQSLNIQSLKKELEERFSTLTSQEFLIFLTIYQLEEDFNRLITYNDLSNKLGLTHGCIRGYVSALMRKNLPILKSKINNRTLTLSINPDFKDLNLKQKLTNLYYDQDPDQTKLF
jgi:hypothetical protein